MNVAIIGTGLIGGSLGMALRALPEVQTVTAYDRDAVSARRAVERGAADRVAGSAAEACRGADVVFVATPVGAITSALAECVDAVQDRIILSDVGSTKSRVVREADRLIASKKGISFIGGHPMAGSEHEGVEAARADLFEGAWWVLTPSDTVNTSAYQTLHRILSAIGARVMALEASRHDELMAVISHLPQLTATTLMNLAAEKGREHGGLLALAAGGFRDVTRVAASNPELWVEICIENRDAIAAELKEFAERLLSLHQSLKDSDTERLQKELITARDARRALGKKEIAGDLFDVELEIPDRPGVLADVTRLVGEQGINIEDIGISHAAEGGRGSLRICIAGDDESQKVERALSKQGFSVQRIRL
ncbi:MAG: prephenate dehydrogenase/arogenate dehydrogenase family protein [Actinomycetota bacterium]|nr:prephenate dehydrogenase [Actinomycetota bacterium]